MPQDPDELCGLPRYKIEWVDSLRRNLAPVIPVHKIVLFGSRARGNHTTWSDYDICVVSNGFEGKTLWERMDIVLAAWEGERALEPFCLTKTEFGTLSSVWREVLDEGIVLFNESDVVENRRPAVTR